MGMFETSELQLKNNVGKGEADEVRWKAFIGSRAKARSLLPISLHSVEKGIRNSSFIPILHE